mgnify:CR=1 FL=1
MKKIKAFLCHNEIYFKTVIPALISFVAVILSLWSYQISRNQTEILKLQTRIINQQVLPNFHLAVKPIYNDVEGRFLEERLETYNNGGDFSDIKLDKAIFLRIGYNSKDFKGKEILIPVDGYYDTTIAGIVGDKVLMTLLNAGGNNNLRAVQLDKEFGDYARSLGGYGSVSVERYFKLTYEDIFGEAHSNYYYVNPINGSSSISEGDGISIFASFKNQIGIKGDKTLTIAFRKNFNNISVNEMYVAIDKEPFQSKPYIWLPGLKL